MIALVVLLIILPFRKSCLAQEAKLLGKLRGEITEDFAKWKVTTEELKEKEVIVTITLKVLREWGKDDNIRHGLYLKAEGYELLTAKGSEKIDDNSELLFFESHGASSLKVGEVITKKIHLKEIKKLPQHEIVTLGISTVFSRLYDPSFIVLLECADYQITTIKDTKPKTISVGHTNYWPEKLKELDLERPRIRMAVLH